MVSIIILTKDEEQDLPGCLASLSWCDDVHVLDSGSTDKTTIIAEEYGAKVWVNKFEGFGKQRNYALDQIPAKYEWILFLDADEHSTEKFKNEVLSSIAQADESVAGFYCCCKLTLEGKWLKRSDTFPKWQFRLLKKGKARYTNMGHGQKECDIKGEIKYIREGYIHYGMSKGWQEWIERHNRYSSQEAVLRYYNCPPFRNIFLKHSSLRNVALKSWLSKIAIWPFVRFFYAYIINLGFIEGKQGFLYCINNFYYEFMITIKYREIKLKERKLKYAHDLSGNIIVTKSKKISAVPEKV